MHKERGIILFSLVALLSLFLITLVDAIAYAGPGDDEAEAVPIQGVDFCSSDRECERGIRYCGEEVGYCIGFVTAPCDGDFECSSTLGETICDIPQGSSSGECRYPISSSCAGEGECVSYAGCVGYGRDRQGSQISGTCEPTCTQTARNGQQYSGCVGQRCTSNSQCASGNWCYIAGVCAALLGDRCVTGSDCVSGSCYRGFCQISSCSNDAQCGEGRTCQEQRCIETTNFCFEDIDCGDGFTCSSGYRCRRACEADYNCNIGVSNQNQIEACTTSTCRTLCNTEEEDSVLQIDNADSSYAFVELARVNPYTYRTELAQTSFAANLRTLEYGELDGNERGTMRRILGYRGDVAYLGENYQIFVFGSELYVLFEDGSYVKPTLRETALLGAYATDPVRFGGQDANIAFVVQERAIVVNIRGVNIATIRLRPLVVYSFSYQGFIGFLFVNNCNINYDCTENSHCSSGQACQANACVRSAGGRFQLPNFDIFPFRNNRVNIDPGVFFDLVNNCRSNDDCNDNEGCTNGVCEAEPPPIDFFDPPSETEPAAGDAEEAGSAGTGVGGGTGGTGTGGGSQAQRNVASSSRCSDNNDCTLREYCLNGACLPKNAIRECQENGVVCDIGQRCGDGTGRVISNILCCEGTDNACVSLQYNSNLGSRAVISKSNCVDGDGDSMGVREVSLCYPGAVKCSASSDSLIPAEELGLNSNPYNEPCEKPSEQKLKIPFHATLLLPLLGLLVLATIITLVVKFKPKTAGKPKDDSKARKKVVRPV